MQQRVTLGALREDDAHRRRDGDDRGRDRAARRRARAGRRAAQPRRGGARGGDAGGGGGRARSSRPGAFEPALRDDDWRVRRAAVTGLSPHAHRDMLASLLTALRDEHRDFNVLSSALSLLATSDVDVTGPLIELLRRAGRRSAHAGGAGARRAASPGGGRRAGRGRSAIPTSNVRFHAIEALGRLRAADAVEPLADIAECGDFFLAFPAIDALARISDSRVALRLVPMLARDEIREPVIDALGELAGAEAVAAAGRGAQHQRQPPRRSPARWPGCTSATRRATAAAPTITSEFQAALRPAGAERLLDAVRQAPADALPPPGRRARLAARAGGRAGADPAARRSPPSAPT